jgi:hypothetical protein
MEKKESNLNHGGHSKAPLFCPICLKSKKLTMHHMFPQTNLNKRLYGDLIHDERNIFYVCLDCHLTKAIPSLNELEFCRKLGIKPKSKTYKYKI